MCFSGFRSGTFSRWGGRTNEPPIPSERHRLHVSTCSLNDDPGNKQPWKERKEAYVERLRKESADVRLISIADKLYNARAILDDYREIRARVWERFKRGRTDQIWYFDELLAVYKSSGPSRIVDELERVVNKLREISAVEAH